MNTSRIVGIPPYIASGSHYFGDARYRFLVLPRFDCDLHAVIKNCRVKDACVLTLAVHVLDALEELHSQGYCHNDIKAQNIMITKSNKYYNIDTHNISNKNQKSDYEDIPHTTDSGNSSDVDDNAKENEEKVKKRLRRNKKSNGTSNHVLSMECYADKNNYMDDDEMITTTTTNSNDSNSLDPCFTPVSTLATERQRRRHVTVDFHGSNPVRSCRKSQNNDKNTALYDEMVKSHYLRPRGRISYLEFFNENGGTESSSGGSSTVTADSYFQSNNFISHNDVSSTSSDDDDDSEEFLPPGTLRRSLASKRKFAIKKRKSSYRNYTEESQKNCKRLTRRQEKILAIRDKEERAKNTNNNNNVQDIDNSFDMFGKNLADQMFLIDFGLASKYMDNGIHRPFVMDQRRAHDGTLEFTSRDAHLGAHSRRSDLECLGYNMLFWSQGYLPWREAAQNHQQEKVHRAKEYLMTDVRTILKNIYGNQIPKFIGEYLHIIGQLGYQERPNYARYRRLFERAYQQEERKGLTEGPMKLCRENICNSCIRMKPEVRKDLIQKFDMVNCSFIKNSWIPNIDDSIRECKSFETPLKSFSIPFNNRVQSGNRVSPKNLRSKSTKKRCLKESKQIDSQPPTSNELSLSEILAQDPDQIARCRAEKEFEREEQMLVKSETGKARVRHFQGKPTYAILEMLRRRGMEYNPIKIELRVKRDSDSTWRVALNHQSLEKYDAAKE